MSDTAATEAPAEPAAPAEPVPAAQAEATAAPAPETEPEVESEDNRTAREKVLDHFADCDDPDQSVAQIIQGTGLSRNTCEQAIFRAVQSEQLQRVSQGVYRLAPPKPPRPPSPEPPPPSPAGHTDEEWIARIEAWQVNPASWNIEEDGPPPNDPNHRIPLDVVGRFKDRQAREAKEREKREDAAAKQKAVDAELRNQLLAACNGNFTPGPGLDDLSPIKMALELVPLDHVLFALRCKVDRRCYPGNPPLTSWRNPKLLKAIADSYCSAIVIPSMVDAWGKAAAKAPGVKAHETLPPAGHTPDDIDNLRSQHDHEHAPPGPHDLPKPPMDEDAGATPSVAPMGCRRDANGS
jgi:hypothetical protein